MQCPGGFPTARAYKSAGRIGPLFVVIGTMLAYWLVAIAVRFTEMLLLLQDIQRFM
jgi:hypothetical protein